MSNDKQKRLTVNASKSYDIIIKKHILDEAGERIKELFPSSRVAVITDDIVDRLYGEKLMTSFKNAGIEACKASFKHGEEQKTLATCEAMFDFLSENNITRSDLVVALGGGIAGDLAGFVSGVHLRGISFVNIPTTLLAMIDSSVGGKTGVNTSHGKNQVGAIWQPSLVLIDPLCLETLEDEIFSDGIAEAIKYGVIRDEKILSFLLKGKDFALQNIEELIFSCVSIKRDVVQNDERDTGERMILNFGHTIAHAIEKHSNHKLSHGRAVAVGMVLIEKLLELEESGCKLSKEIENLCKLYNLPTDYEGDREELFKIIGSDKKRQKDEITIVLAKEVGKAYLKRINIDDLKIGLLKI